MKLGIKLSLVAAACYASLSTLAQSWMLTSAPTKAWVSITSSTDGNTLMAAIDGGTVYVSTNAGTTWEPTSAPINYYQAVASSGDGTVMVAAVSGGPIFISTNSGAVWVQSSAPSQLWYSACSSADGSKLFAASYWTILASTNGGLNWSDISPFRAYWESIACSTDGNKLLAADFGGWFNNVPLGRVVTSSNAGQTWTDANVPAGLWQSVASSEDGVNLVAHDALGGLVYTSYDSGVTWAPTGWPSDDWQSMASSSDGTRLLASTYHSQLYISTDSGTTWISNSVPSGNIPSVSATSVASSADGSKLVVAVYGGGIYTLHATAPSAVTLPPTKTDVGIALNAMVNPNGLPTSAWFEWGVNTNYGNATTPIILDPGWTNVSLSVGLAGGLTPRVDYYYRVLATNDLGLAYGTNILFRLPDTTPPTIFCPTNITVEFTSAVGAQVFFTVQATDLYSGILTVNCAPPSGSTFPIGTNTVTCTAADDSGNMAQTNFLVIVLGARGVKRDVLAEMEALQAARVGHFPLLDGAITSLTHSLGGQLWTDEVHLKAQNGQNVFPEDLSTVFMLSVLMEQKQNFIAKGVLQGWINRLVKADRLLATVEIASATNAGATPQRLSNASKEIIQGDKAANKQQYVSAIILYQNAWNMAMRLVGSRVTEVATRCCIL
jgi:hypothetical protein